MEVNDIRTGEDAIVLASSKSTRVSLAGIRVGRYALSQRRENLLQRVPKSGDFVFLEKNSLELMDLAFLSARTGDEFAILRSKQNDVLFHGESVRCRFVGTLEEGLIGHKYELIGHSHPGEEEPEPSPEDRALLNGIGQKRSSIISARTGRITNFTADPFE